MNWQFWRRPSEEQELPSPEQAAALRLQRSDARLWIAAAVGLTCTACAFLVANLPRSANAHFSAWDISPERAAQALLGLFLLFHIDLLYRRWQIRREQRALVGLPAISDSAELLADEPSTDPVTGLATIKSAEQQLDREMALARRSGEPLSVLAIGLEEVNSIAGRYGEAAAGRALQDFTRRLRRATRGCDVAARTGSGEFLAVLPGCTLESVKRVVERLGPVTTRCNGNEMPLRYSTAWVDAQPNESTSEFLKRARLLLKLYKDVEGPEVSSERR